MPTSIREGRNDNEPIDSRIEIKTTSQQTFKSIANCFDVPNILGGQEPDVAGPSTHLNP